MKFLKIFIVATVIQIRKMETREEKHNHNKKENEKDMKKI